MKPYQRVAKFINSSWRVSLAVFVLALVLASVGVVFAVHNDGVFEIDGNVTDEAGTVGDDWKTLFTFPGGGDSGSGSAVKRTYLTDPKGFTLFVQGSKDILEINTDWHCADQNAPDKDEITSAFAAVYTPSSGPRAGHTLLYFGLDRFANNGDAQLGFWFLQDDTVGCDPAGTGDFTGSHQVGDFLVLANFVQGGGQTNIQVHKVTGISPLVLTKLVDETTGANLKCNDGIADPLPADTVCAATNGAVTASLDPAYNDKGPTAAGSYDNVELAEGGIDLTNAGLTGICTNKFLAETRASQSITAQQKDFVLGEFELCAISVEKTGDTLSKIGDDVNYTITITNDGAVTLYKQSIIDTLLGDLTGNAGCAASLAPGASCTINVLRTVLPGDPDPLPNTVTVVYDSRSDLLGDEVTDSDDHSVNLFQPSLTIDKTGDELSKVGDSVSYTIEVCNTSSADSPDLIKDSVSDSLIAGVDAAFGASLAFGVCESHNFSRTVLAGDPDPLVNTATAHYHPDGFPNDITDSDDHSVNLFQPSVDVLKECTPASAHVGEVITYTCTIDNTSSLDSPSLILDSVSDTLTGTNPADLTAAATAAGCDVLTSNPSETCSFSYTRTILSTDPDPLVNTVTVHYHPLGFTNDITDSALCTVDIIAGEGCTPGFWKTHPELWDGVGGDDVTTTIQTTDGFNATFGVTSAQSGLADSLTLFDALSVSGSDLNALNRHAAAGLVSADSGIDYTFSLAEVIALYRDAVGADAGPETITTAHDKLKAANELNCPLS